MSHPLIDRLTRDLGWPRLSSLDEVAAHAATPGTHVVFVPGDPVRNLESADVAVILPELVKAFDGVFAPAVVARPAERKLQARFRFAAFPALVFLRDGLYLGAITRVLDWADYLTEIAEILGREPSDPPPFRLPEARPRGDDDLIH